MSHFAVLVVTPSGTDEEVTKALAPYHEYECTGRDDEFVVDVDRTEEALAAFKADTVVRLKGPDGTLHERFDKTGNWKPEFSKLKDDGRFADRVEFVPPGYERVEVPASDVEASCDWIRGYYGWPIAGEDEVSGYGYIQVDGERNVVKCIDRTNPNAKWDWWTVGGRWQGHLLSTKGAKMDSLRKSNIAVETMRQQAATEAGRLWDRATQIRSEHPVPTTWDKMVEAHPGQIEVARDAYHSQPAMVALKSAADISQWNNDPYVEAMQVDRDSYTAAAAKQAIMLFGFVDIEGRWNERGKMGWWACVSGEMSKAEWADQFNAWFDSVPDDHFLTVVDCHI